MLTDHFYLGFIGQLDGLSLFGRTLIVLIVSGFMPFTAISFFKFMMPKKEKEYNKSLKEMGISTSRKVRDYFAPSRYILPVSFAFLICFLSITYVAFAEQFVANITDSLLLTGGYFGEANKEVILQSFTALGFAFLGGFIWSAQNIIRRLIAYDLAPDVYYSAGIRIILASVVSVIFSLIIGEDSSDSIFSVKASLAIIAFLTGMFPERILNYMINLYKQYFSPDELNSETLSLYHIEGMSLAHKERLNEIGIDNAQNLATTSLTKLCAETPFEARQILDWIGQAKLLCYLKEDMDKVRQAGIRTVFDFLRGDKSTMMLSQIADSTGINPNRLRIVADQILSDNGIRALYKFQHGVNEPNEKKDATVIPTIPEPPNPVVGENSADPAISDTSAVG